MAEWNVKHIGKKGTVDVIIIVSNGVIATCNLWLKSCKLATGILDEICVVIRWLTSL